ncbi:hypothetical protein J2T17_001451 [Paenibacillus mucilaginosus]|uniref:hypothetical protein n=1 Tax=Paenibacillus mucilaginosus TaxID=61624 RepID=UPI003D1AF78C
MTMWESEFMQGRLRIAMNPTNERLLFEISSPTGEAAPLSLEMNQSEMFELLHVFLQLNRSFNRETMYFDELEAPTSLSRYAAGN